MTRVDRLNSLNVFRLEFIKRFLSKINVPDVNSEDYDQCWIYKAFISDKNYPRFKVTPSLIVSVHRYSYSLLKNNCKFIDDNIFVLHKCDNRHCINPNHLFLGTQLDNIKDMCSKNRQAQGEKLSKALSRAYVDNIRNRVRRRLLIKSIENL